MQDNRHQTAFATQMTKPGYPAIHPRLDRYLIALAASTILGASQLVGTGNACEILCCLAIFGLPAKSLGTMANCCLVCIGS